MCACHFRSTLKRSLKKIHMKISLITKSADSLKIISKRELNNVTSTSVFRFLPSSIEIPLRLLPREKMRGKVSSLNIKQRQSNEEF